MLRLAGRLAFFEVAAWRLFDRAMTSGRAGQLTINLSNDEAQAHALTMWALIDAVQELA